MATRERPLVRVIRRGARYSDCQRLFPGRDAALRRPRAVQARKINVPLNAGRVIAARRPYLLGNFFWQPL